MEHWLVLDGANFNRWHNYDYATVSRQIVHSISRAPNANDRSHKLYLALLFVWLMTWLRSQSSRQSHQHNTDNLANSTTWQQTALQSANSTTSTNTLSEITVDRYSNIQGNIWLNIDRYVILAYTHAVALRDGGVFSVSGGSTCRQNGQLPLPNEILVGKHIFLPLPKRWPDHWGIIWVEGNISASCIGVYLSGHCFTDWMLGLLREAV